MQNNKTLYKKIWAVMGFLFLAAIGLHFIFDKPIDNPPTDESAAGSNPTAQATIPQTQEESGVGQTAAEKTLQVEILQEGSGEGAKSGDSLVVHYTGTLENGQKFDSSLDRGNPILVKLGEGKVIAGWEQGLLGMKVGEKRRLTIPPSLAYGPQGSGDVIPPNATLIFEVELLFINPIKNNGETPAKTP